MTKPTKEPPQIFLCYARKDEKPVAELYKKLSDAGFKPFMDTKDILPGEDWKQKLMNTIREALDVWRQKLAPDIYFIPVRLAERAGI